MGPWLMVFDLQHHNIFVCNPVSKIFKTDASPLHKYYTATNKSKPDHVSVDIVPLATETKVSK
jgi:hypothetical protein